VEPARTASLTFAEYVAREAESDVEHEYVNGEIFTRNDDDGSWTFRSVESPGSVRLPSIGCELALDAVYRDPLAG